MSRSYRKNANQDKIDYFANRRKAARIKKRIQHRRCKK
jgi:hypothetical protein